MGWVSQWKGGRGGGGRQDGLPFDGEGAWGEAEEALGAAPPWHNLRGHTPRRRV